VRQALISRGPRLKRKERGWFLGRFAVRTLYAALLPPDTTKPVTVAVQARHVMCLLRCVRPLIAPLICRLKALQRRQSRQCWLRLSRVTRACAPFTFTRTRR